MPRGSPRWARPVDAGRRRNEALLAAAGDLAIVGPNCFGIINYVNHGSLWSAPYLADAEPRGAAVVAQSGNVCINLSMNQQQVPFSYIISAGNQAVLGFEDYIEVLLEGPERHRRILEAGGTADPDVHPYAAREL